MSDNQHPKFLPPPPPPPLPLLRPDTPAGTGPVDMASNLSVQEESEIYVAGLSRQEYEQYCVAAGLAKAPDVAAVEAEAREAAKRGGPAAEEALARLYRARRGVPEIPRQPSVSSLSPRQQQAITARAFAERKARGDR